MPKVKVSELRQNLPAYLAEVRKGEEIEVTVHGKVIARIVPEEDRSVAARKFLKSLRRTAKIGDLISPSGDVWRAERDRSRDPRTGQRRARS
jgi:prevent-host-death family protein